MPNKRAALALAALMGLAACGGEPGPPTEGSETSAPAPPGAEVGATGADATATPVPPDSQATKGAHP